MCNTEKKQIGIGFLDSSKAQITISNSIKNNTKEFSYIAPTNAKYVVFYISKTNISESASTTIGDVRVYINNAIDELKKDLGGLSFSVSGTTLSITNGINTWTLEAN